MQHAVCHMTKAKAGSSGGLTNHIDRVGEKAQENVYSDRSNENFELVQVTGTIDEMVKDKIGKGYKGEKAIRKDAVTSCRYILSGSHEKMSEIGRDPIKIRQWAIDNYEFFAKKYGEENIVRATVHMDEKTPHMHLIAVPITKDGKLSAKEITGSKGKLRDLQTEYAKEVGEKWELARGVENSPRKHIKSKDFYKYLNSKEITADWILNHPNKKEIISTLLAENDNINDITKKKQVRLQSDRTKSLNNQKTANNGIERGIQKESGGVENRRNPKRDTDKGNNFSI